MKENIDEEPLDNPISPQSENLSDETISPNDRDFIITNQEK